MIITSKVKDYSVEICSGLLSDRQNLFGNFEFGRPYFFVDKHFASLYEDELRLFIGPDYNLLIESLETNKEYDVLANYYKELIDNGFTRNDVLVTIGGGILQDISGFVASTLYRGIKWVFLPTTLLAQADSCIGSKTSINFRESKNLIGSFYPPDVIRIDPGFCQTLSSEYFNSGIGEIIKFHLMSDNAGYETLKHYLFNADPHDPNTLSEIILSTLKIKKSYFDADEFDTGRRNLLNYGHCFGHALESASDFRVCHGEAVIVGMGFANLLSAERKIMSPEKHEEFEALLKPYYPSFDLAAIPVSNLIGYLKRDKKRTGKDLTMILSADVGRQFKYDDIKESEIRTAYERFLDVFPGKRKGRENV